MYSLFYILAFVFLVLWVLSFTVWALGLAGHLLLVVALVMMTIGLVRRSARN